MTRKASSKPADSNATIGFEISVPVRKDLAADKLRNNMDAAVTERSANPKGLGHAL